MSPQGNEMDKAPLDSGFPGEIFSEPGKGLQTAHDRLGDMIAGGDSGGMWAQVDLAEESPIGEVGARWECVGTGHVGAMGHHQASAGGCHRFFPGGDVRGCRATALCSQR